MADYPSGAVERQALRDRYRAEHVARAVQSAARVGLSLKCVGVVHEDPVDRVWVSAAVHAGDVGGCRNDGTGCLCACHDQPACTCRRVDVTGFGEQPKYVLGPVNPQCGIHGA